MCGRYVSEEEASIERHWNLIRGGGDPFGPVYNAAPTMRLPIVRDHPKGARTGASALGPDPDWAKDPAIGVKTINARAETLEGFRTSSIR